MRSSSSPGHGVRYPCTPELAMVSAYPSRTMRVRPTSAALERRATCSGARRRPVAQPAGHRPRSKLTTRAHASCGIARSGGRAIAGPGALSARRRYRTVASQSNMRWWTKERAIGSQCPSAPSSVVNLTRFTGPLTMPASCSDWPGQNSS